MKSQVENLSALIDTQLPNFIVSEYPNFAAFLQKYYEYLELPGNPIDLINNIVKYRDIDTYDKKILNQSAILTSPVNISDTTIFVENTESFPKNNGYLLIDSEIIFYKFKTPTSFENCYRNVNSTIKLGDLYSELQISDIPYEEVGNGEFHGNGISVLNVTNLFLYALVKNFESEYLGPFPENLLKNSVDKSLLIKNIKHFYASKGTEQSIKFIFNSLVNVEEDSPKVYYPKDNTIKASGGEWVTTLSLRAKVLSGDPKKIIGSKLIQESTKAFGVIDNIIVDSNGDCEIIFSDSSLVGDFKISAKTVLTKTLLSTENSKIYVESTLGFATSDSIIINQEVITFSSKNINQFTISNRGTTPSFYDVGEDVYEYIPAKATELENENNEVKLIIVGSVKNFNIDVANPYSEKNEPIFETSTFESRDNIVYDTINDNYRWLINDSLSSPSSTNINISNSLSDTISDVSAIYQDSQYFYIASSGYPSYSFGKSTWNVSPFVDNKILRLLPKKTSLTSTIYETPKNDIGVLINGTLLYGYKDQEEIVYGEVVDIEVTNPGEGYVAPPYVIIEDIINSSPASAYSVLSGEVVDKIIIKNAGEYKNTPNVTITSGRNAKISAAVTLGRVTSLKIENPGEYYSSPPEIIIRDKRGNGRFARFKSIVDNGKIIDFIKEDEGKFYTQENIVVDVIPVGRGATAVAKIKKWNKNRIKKLESVVDNNNGIYYKNEEENYGYAHISYPSDLKNYLNDDGSHHSPIIGFAYDGNPIYGPYGYLDATDDTSNVVRMTSSYSLISTVKKRPPKSQYPLGTFVEDYAYHHRSGSLDENNGRFCVTPDYPEGTYAYFVTLDETNSPVFPYVIGKNYYSLPVTNNYNNIIQDDIPKNVKRISPYILSKNGYDVVSYVNDVYTGGVDSVDVEYSTPVFSVGSQIYDDNPESNIISKVSSLKGKNVIALENNQTKAIKIQTETNCYLFDGDIITQSNSNASGEIVGDVFDSNIFVIRNTNGVFNTTDTISSETEVTSVILDKPSTFTRDSVLRFVNGKKCIIKSVSANKLNVNVNPFFENEPIIFTNSFSGIESNKIYYVVDRKVKSFKVATTPNGTPINIPSNTSPSSVAEGEKGRSIILESTEERNNVKIRVTDGNFAEDTSYYLLSSTLTDSATSTVVSLVSLSSNIKIFNLNDNIALVKTDEEHGISEGDIVNITINPDDSLTETTFYVRKRAYQKVKITKPSYSSKIIDTGIGRLDILNNGSYIDSISEISGDYANGLSDTFTNVELIFLDQSNTRNGVGKPGDINNAKANISVTNGIITNISLQSKGSGYIEGDLLTVSDTLLNRIPQSLNSNYLIARVDHVGFAAEETILNVATTFNLSENDFIQVGEEVLKVVDIISSKKIQVLRSQKNTVAIDHYHETAVSLEELSYNLTKNYQPNNSYIIEDYNSSTGELLVSYPVNFLLNSSSRLVINSNFLDESVPAKLVSVKEIIDDISYKFEFSKDLLFWNKNPILPIQNNYKYKFDLSSSTLRDSFFEISPSNNYNIFTIESDFSDTLPGNSGAYYSVKFGYGENIASNDFTNKEDISYTIYYYYDKSEIIDSEKSYVQVVSDPLQGKKLVNYTTPLYFSYELNDVAAYDGYGDISYTTTSETAVGEIDFIKIFNPGKNLSELPIISGVLPSIKNICTAKAEVFDGKIKSISILNGGLNYSKPKVYISNSSGSGAEFDVYKNNQGKITQIIIKKSGKNYESSLDIKVLETDVKLFYSSNTIGKPKSIIVKSNGNGFNSDISLLSKYSTKTVLKLKQINFENLNKGDVIEQYKNNSVIASGVVESWRKGSNLLKLFNVIGKFEINLEIINQTTNQTALVVSDFTSLFSPNTSSSTLSQKGYASSKSHLSDVGQKLADSYFYQDYSYVIKSKSPINKWRKLVIDTVHPAGFKVFGDLVVDTTASIPQPENPPVSTHVSFIQLWGEDTNRITVEKVTKTNIVSMVTLADTAEQRGKGYIASPYIETADTSTYDLELFPEFDGYFDDSGNKQGTKTFTMNIRGSNTPISVTNINNLVLTLDGILQSSESSFTVNGNQITFSEAPLGYRDRDGNSISASNYISGVDTPKQNFVGRFISLKNISENNNLFKKIKDISSQFDGIKKEFDLYYEDNSPCLLQNRENLLVSIDGVLQRVGETPLFPYDKSYYISRLSTPNKIIFNEAPKQQTKFNGYSIGNYYRLNLAEEIDENNNGVFALRSEVDGRNFIVDNERNLFVFVDGVLQVRNKSYSFGGNFIKFKKPLTPGQKIYMIFCYGSDIDRTLTSFDYSDKVFDSEYTLRINNLLFNFYTLRNVLEGKTVYSFDFNGPLWETESNIVRYKKVSNNIWDIVLRNRGGSKIDITKDLRIVGVGEIPGLSLISISDYSRESSTGYKQLYDYTGQRYEYIEKGDLIKIDGENNYREVKENLSSPIGYENNYSPYFTKFKTSNNNDIIPGVSLSAEAILDSNGSVSGIEWFGEKMPNYLTKNNSKFVGRAKLIFIPQPVLNDGGDIISLPEGSGAAGFVYFNENKVVTTIITNTGSGYLIPPKVYVALGYDIKKSRSNIVKRQINSIIPSTSTESFASFGAPQAEITFRYKGQELEGFYFVEAFIINDINRIDLDIRINRDSIGVYGNIIPNIRLSSGFDPYLIVNSLFAEDSFINRFYETSNEVLPSVAPSQDNSKSILTIFNVSQLNNTRIQTGGVINYPAGLLQIPFNEQDTILYIGNTDKFANSGYLLLGTEIVYYNSKLSDRFFIQERGAFNSIVSFHDAGIYLRQYEPDLSNIDSSTYTSILTGQIYLETNTPVSVTIQPVELSIVTKSSASENLNVSGSEVIIERNAQLSIVSENLNVDLQEINKEVVSEIAIAGVDSITLQSTMVSVGGRLEDVAVDVFGGVATAFSAAGEEITTSVIASSVFSNIASIQEITVTPGIQIPDNSLNVLLQSVLISVGGREQDIAIDVLPVFGGVAGAFSITDQDITSSVIASSVFANIESIQEITITPYVTESNASIISGESIVITNTIDQPLEDSGSIEYQSEINVGLINIIDVFPESITTSVNVETVFANITSIQEITVTPYVKDSEVTIASITTVSTDDTSEGEVIFIQTNSITSEYIASELSIEIVETEITPIIVPKVFVDTQISAEININQQLIIEENSVIDISPNEVIANDVNNIQIYRTIETGLGENGAGISVLGEYPYQSELVNVSPQNIIIEVNLGYQQILDSNITTIQEITVTPPIDDSIATLANIESIIVTSNIDESLEDSGAIEYQAQLYVGVTAPPAPSTGFDAPDIKTVIIESRVSLDVDVINEVVAFYDSLRTTQTTLPEDPEALTSPVSVIVDSVVTSIDKPINAQNIPIEPLAAVRITAPDSVIITNTIIPEKQLINTSAYASDIIAIRIVPKLDTSVDAESAITTYITTIIDKDQETVHVANNVISEVTVTRSTGILDYYQESLFINKDINTRSGDTVTIDNYQITTNSDGVISARHISEEQQFNRYGTYGLGTLMVSHATVEYNAFFNNVGDDNTVVNTTYLESGASGMGIDEFNRMYPGTTIEDFESRTNSAISRSGDTLNIGISSYTSVDLGANNQILNDKIWPTGNPEPDT